MNTYILNATLNGKMLTEILCKRMDIKGLITLSENADDKSNEYYDYSDYCRNNNLECIKLNKYNFSSLEDRDLLEKLDIDLIIIASWQRLVPEWLIKKCSIGIIGAHGSHEGIERGRGRSPQNWAILTGQKRFILSIFWIEPGTDDGSIIDTEEFEYLPTDTILVSYVQVNTLKAEMILRNIRNGRIPNKEGTPQSDDAFYLPQRIKEDGQIDWNRDAVEISNMVRALTKPYPGAYTLFDKEEFIIWIARPVVNDDIHIYDSYENGTVLSILGKSILVKCKNNLLLIDSITNFEKIYEGMVFQSADYKLQIHSIINRHNEKYGTPLSQLILNEA